MIKWSKKVCCVYHNREGAILGIMCSVIVNHLGHGLIIGAILAFWLFSSEDFFFFFNVSCFNVVFIINYNCLNSYTLQLNSYTLQLITQIPINLKSKCTETGMRGIIVDAKLLEHSRVILAAEPF